MNNNTNDNVFYYLRSYINVLRNGVNSGKYGDANKQKELLEEIEVFESALNRIAPIIPNKEKYHE